MIMVIDVYQYSTIVMIMAKMIMVVSVFQQLLPRVISDSQPVLPRVIGVFFLSLQTMTEPSTFIEGLRHQRQPVDVWP